MQLLSLLESQTVARRSKRRLPIPPMAELETIYRFVFRRGAQRQEELLSRQHLCRYIRQQALVQKSRRNDKEHFYMTPIKPFRNYRMSHLQFNQLGNRTNSFIRLLPKAS